MTSLSPDLQRDREPRTDGARARRRAARRRARARDRRQLARTGPARWPTGSRRSCRVSVLHREQKEGLGRATSPGSPRRSAAAPTWSRDGLRLFPRPEVRPEADRSNRKAADLAIGSRYVAGGGTENWGVGELISRAAARFTRARCSHACGTISTSGFKCFRRAVLERIDLDAIDSTGYAFQIENVYRAIQAGLSRRRGADHVRGPRRRAVEDEPGDRARGDLKVPALRLAAAARHSVAMDEVTDANLRAAGSPGRRSRRRRLLGSVVRAVPRRRPDPGGVRTGAGGPRPLRQAQHRRELRDLVALHVLSIPTAILFAEGEPQASVIGARPRSHFERAWDRWFDPSPSP